MSLNYKIGIMGVGMVGGALLRYFVQQKRIQPVLYDPLKNLDNALELNEADVVFICVPTPYDEEGGGFDLSYIEQAFGVLRGNKIVVIKSTVLPGTTESFQQKYPQHKILFNPEFLTETTADYDMLFPTRQLVGYTEKSKDIAEAVLELLPSAPFKKILLVKEAETVKYFGNTLYALKVAFANQIYDLCQKLGVNYETVKECAKAEPMVGKTHLEIFHKKYRGYGGKCLPKDTRALIQLGERIGVDLSILKTAEKYNNELTAKQGIKNQEKPDLEKER
jgi:UDPglucose 6-dehydrogenase